MQENMQNMHLNVMEMVIHGDIVRVEKVDLI